MSEDVFNVGDRVRISASPPYLKTADSIPMLRPPDLVAVGDEGTILERRLGGYWVVKFERGNFLVDIRYLSRPDSNHTNPSTDKSTALPTTDEVDKG